ncbi:hypothetical protein V492_04714 [Pseudogymnoascus sp. VKM F-4246]|nr:hypothetical protein V492_04714 [Pseudogymnoascus sp. VKM F-4246]
MFISNPGVAAITATVTPFVNRDAVLHHIASRDFFSNDDGDTPIQRWSSLIGIVSSIVGNILISFALNIQRYAHIRIHKELEEKKRQHRQVSDRYGTADGSWSGQNGHDETERLRDSFESSTTSGSESGRGSNDNVEQQSYLQSPYWWVGIVLMTVGETGNFLAYGFAPASIVSPLGVVALISNCVIAPILLKERFRLRDFWGVVVSVLGAVTVVLSAEQEEKKLGPHEVIGAITTMEFEIYMAVTIGVMFALAWASPKYGSKTILIDLGLVALFGAYTVLSTKGVSSMLSTSFWDAFTNPITYALALVLIGTAVMQIKYINRALQRFDSTQVIPVQFVLFTISVILGSAVLYRDFESTSPGRAIKFIGGCLMTFFGVFLITSGRVSHDDLGSDLESDDGAESISLANHDERRASYYKDRNTQRASLNRARPSHELLFNGEAAESDDGFPTDDTSRRSSRISYTQRPRPVSSGDYSTSQPSVPGSAPAAHPLDSASLAALPSTSEATPERPVRPAISRLISQNEYGQPQSDTAALRPTTPARHSAGKPMIPGPLISPFSSSVVADTVRRSTDMYGSRRRPRLDLQPTRSRERRGSTEGLLDSEQNSPTKASRVVDRHSYAEDENMGNGRRSLEIPFEESGGSGRRRAQSLGQRIGGFFRSLGGSAPTTPEGEQEPEDLEQLPHQQN